MTQFLLLSAAVLALAYLLRFSSGSPGLAKSLVKTGSVALLALVAQLGDGPALLVLALVLCALGDWLLADGRESAFMAGVGAFAAGHLAFAALFLTRDAADPARIVAAWWVVAALALFGAVMAGALWSRAGALRVPVIAYVPVILSMGAAVLALPAGLAHLAAASFILSDTVLAAELFLLPKGHRASAATARLVWISYWGAQVLFVAAFVGL